MMDKKRIFHLTKQNLSLFSPHCRQCSQNMSSEWDDGEEAGEKFRNFEILCISPFPEGEIYKGIIHDNVRRNQKVNELSSSSSLFHLKSKISTFSEFFVGMEGEEEEEGAITGRLTLVPSIARQI